MIADDLLYADVFTPEEEAIHVTMIDAELLSAMGEKKIAYFNAEITKDGILMLDEETDGF